MKEPEMSRRKVLSSLAVAGGAGSLVGGGSGAFVTGAFFTDEETFAGNTIQTSENIGGVIDLSVGCTSLEEGSGVAYNVTLPDDVNNNPSYIWLRTETCPTPKNFARNVYVEFRVDCGDGDGYTIGKGALLDVLDDLRTGTLLCGEGDDPCLQTGETRRLELEVFHVDDDYHGRGGPIEFEFEFHGRQCRYETGTENPFPQDVEGCSPSNEQKGISFVAFCSGEKNLDNAIDVDDITVTGWKDDGEEPVELEWQSDEPVQTVVLKTGDGVENFFVGGSTGGTVEVGTGEPPADGQSASSPCPSGDGPKFEWNEDEKAFERDGGKKHGDEKEWEGDDD